MKKSNKKTTLSGTTSNIQLPPSIDKSTENKVIESNEYSKSIDGFLEKKKNEVPLYDPLTGEPNPNYENLTGIKNPLLITPKTLNPSVREYRLKNRFLVYLPKDLNIDTWDVRSISKPFFEVKTKKIFGISYGSKIINSNIELLIYDNIDNQNHKLLEYLEKNKKFSFYIEELDPTGVVIETTKFYDCYLKSINFGNLDYGSCDINKIMMNISFNKITIK